MAKILLAEDDSRLTELISDWLESEKHVVEVAKNGRDAIDLLKLSAYDVLIIDWGLPEIDGIEVMKHHRRSGGTSPIIMLTGKSSIDEKEHGLDQGADDYLTKPFHLKELSARIRAVMRRPSQMLSNTLECRGIVLDSVAIKVTRDGNPVELFPKEFALLEFLLRHPNQVFSVEALQQRIWPTDSDSSPEALRVHIARLRSKLKDDDNHPLLRTVHRQGYMLDTSEG